MKKNKIEDVVYGKSVKDLLDMDVSTFNKLNVNELRKIVSRLVSAGNKRIRNFEKKGISSPTYDRIMKSGGMFSTKGKNLNQLRSEYIRAKQFFESKTSSIRGWNKVRTDTIKSLKSKGINVNNEDWDKMWKAYEKLKELSPEVSNKGFKYVVLANINNLIVNEDLTSDEIINRLENQLNIIYEERAGTQNGFSGVSGFFEM